MKHLGRVLVLGLLSFAMMGTASAAPPSNAIHYYEMDEGSGTTIFDSKSSADLNGNDASLSNGWTTADGETVYEWNSDNNATDTFFDTTKFSGGVGNLVSNDFTLVYRVKEPQPSSTNILPFTVSASNGAGCYINLGFNPNFDSGANWFNSDACSGSISQMEGTTAADNTWRILALRRDGDSINLFNEGSQVASTSGDADYSDLDTFNFGKFSTQYHEAPEGLYDYLAIYDYALSKSEIQSFEDQGLVTNKPPTFDSVSASPSPLLIGETADFSYNANDPDGSIQSVELTLKDDGTQIFTGSKSTASGTFSPSVNLTQGNINVTFTATDNAGATATTTISESLQDTKPEFTIEKPVDNKLQGSTDIQVEVKNTEDDNKPGENPTVNLKIDGTNKQSFTVQDTEDFTKTVTGKEGSQTLTVEMVENDGDTTSKTRTVEIDTTPPNVTIEKPVEGSRTNSTTGIPLKFTVSDVNLDSSSFEYRKDGGALFQTSGNTTVDFGTIGSHNITVFAEDTLGNRGQDTVQFTADTKNTLTATDKVTNVQLDNIEARFSNGTSVLEKSVNDSSLEFFTSNIPKGDVNFTVSITGFSEKTRTLQNVDKSFNQDISVSLERAGLSLNVFNEEKPDKELERTVIFSNSTSKQQLNKTFLPTDFGGVNTETIQEFNSRTYLDQNKNTPVKAGTLLFDTPYDGGGGDLEYDVYINGDFEKTVKAFNKDSATVKLDEPKRITSLRLEAENRDDGDTYDESATAQAENFRVKAPDKGRTIIDFNALQNSKIPTGQDIEITVEGPENFVTRSYFTDITENSKTTLDAFLLKENQGILMTVEARGPENEPVNDALVTVQFQKDNKFKTVAQKKTASDGSAALRLSPNRQYKLDVKKTGLQSFSGTFSPANYQFDPLKIRLGETNNFQKSNTWDSIEFKLLPRTQKLNESPKLNFSVVDSETGITSFGIKVKNSNGTIIDSSLVSGSSSGGSTTLQPNLSNLNNVEIEGFFVKEEEEYKVERDYQVKRSLSPGVASISNIANSFNTVSQGTRSLLAVLVTGFVAFSLKSRVNKKGGSIVTISTLGLFVLIGWIPAFYWMLSLLAIIGILSIR